MNIHQARVENGNWNRPTFMKENIKKEKKKSIAHRLFKIIFLTYFIVTCVVTVTQLYLEYQKVLNDLQVTLKNLAITFQPVVTEALWAYNDTELDAILFGMVKLDSITAVKIMDEGGQSNQWGP